MISTERVPCRSLHGQFNERRWGYFLLASAAMPVAILIPLLIWNAAQKIRDHMAGPDAPRKRKNWQARINVAISQIVSDQTTTGQILKLFGFIVSVGSLAIYLDETSRPCLDTELCHQAWTTNVFWLVDMNFNSYLLVYYLLRLLATHQKLRFMVQPTSFADYFNIPCSFLAIFLNRNWFGLRFLRVINLVWATDLLHRWRILKNMAQVQLMRLGIVILVFIVSGGGAFLVLECGGDFWDAEGTHVENMTIWDYAYFSVVTISTVGYGDISARTTMGRVFSTLFIFVCVIYLATLMSSVAHLLPAPQRYPQSDRNLNFNHVIVCGHVTSEMANQFLSDFYDDAKTKGSDKIQVVFLHPKEPDDGFVVLLNNYQSCVEYIKGSPLNDADLERARALNASVCLVFANLRASDPDADDAATVLRVLSIKNFCPTIKVQVSVIKTSTLNFLRKYPSINLRKGDVIFCFKNLKNGLIGINCRVPGSATILSDLIAARSPAETWPDNCPELYALGRKMKPFSVPLSSSFWGLNFKEVTAICYRKLKILLIGVYETFEDSGEQSNFIPNPGPSFVITEMCRGQIICATSRESARATFYCDKCHPDVNPDKIRKCHCRRWKRKTKVVVPTVLVHGPTKGQRLSLEYSNRGDLNMGSRKSCFAESQNKKFFADRRDSFSTRDKLQLPRKSVSEAVMEQYKRSVSEPGTRTLQLAPEVVKPQFDSTGMFWWCPPQNFENIRMTLQQAAVREFADHVLICMLATGQSPASGIHDIILPLRSSVLKYSELKEIVILGDPEVIRPEWHFICTTPKIFIVEGNATIPAAVRACYINRCQTCVILSGGISATKIDTSEDTVLADRDVIVTTLNVKAMDFSSEGFDGLMDSLSGRKFPYEHGINIPMISSLEYERSVRFLSQDRNYLDFRYTFAHMSGSVVVSTALDSMMTSMFYNPGLAMSFTQLIYGGESTDFERAFAEGVGLVGGETDEDVDEDGDADRDEETEERASSAGSSSRRMKVQLKLMSMKSEQFDRLEGLTYADLWSYALVHYEMICLGLYLLERDTDEKPVKKSHRGKRYVASNPPGHVRLHASDEVYVLMPSVIIQADS
ncbi:Calcium-activated potassium channel slowpoke [Hypsibius exemplaris]|uniref:BK channel n=1 Tax=Hypsibius exemplaris TaxID=2072580 RepID=A0A1W0WB55_HYPEX|nr:Calcium-activated potassium channel slowpoke [Hypsibius exemplaris]